MPEPKNYDIEIIAFKIGDPTFLIELKCTSDTITNLHVEVELTISGTILVLDTTIPTLTQGQVALLMGSFAYPSGVPTEDVAGQLSLTTNVSGDIFSVSSAEGVAEFATDDGNTFTTEDTPIIANSSLSSSSVIENGNIVAVQCIDDATGNQVFLTGTPSTSSVAMLSTFNPFLNPGSKWQLITGPHSGTFYLKCLASGTDVYLYGETSNGDVELATQSSSHKKLWKFNLNSGTGTNVYNIECYESSGSYKHLEGDTDNDIVSLATSYSTTNKAVNWYLTKIN